MTSKRKPEHGKHPKHGHTDPGSPPAQALAPEVSPAAGPDAASSGGPALLERPEDHVQRITEQLEAAKDQHLRLAAEYDNFRKRTARERTELRTRSQAEVVSNILDALDDLGRVAHLDVGTVTAKDVLSGVEMVERKILRELESAGLQRVGQVGERFDPNAHEAITSLPAPAAAEDHTVAAVFQPGYRFGGALIRPARVQVYLWPDAAGSPDAPRAPDATEG
jgi:molecular chaperone GrpE